MQETLRTMNNRELGLRFRAIRKQHSLSQEEVAKVFGFKERQTVSAIETGIRRLTATELLRAVEVFDSTIEYFTDPFQVVDQVEFSWRQRGADPSVLREYETKAGGWLVAYRNLAPRVGKDLPLLQNSLRLNKSSRYEDAMAAGERFVRAASLGRIPASRLMDVLQNDFSILILMVDTPNGISGASCHLPEFDTLLVSRREVIGRRNFDIAHELFHILTWDTMPPQHSPLIGESKLNRTEKLADNFAGAVLMPRETIDQFGEWNELSGESLHSKLNRVADKLQVSAVALKWRLLALNKISKDTANAVSDRELRYNGKRGKRSADSSPELFSKPYVEVVGHAIDKGLVSARRMCSILNLTIEDLNDLYIAYGLPYSIDL